jgi:hypothetical protein
MLLNSLLLGGLLWNVGDATHKVDPYLLHVLSSTNFFNVLGAMHDCIYHEGIVIRLQLPSSAFQHRLRLP